MRSCWWWRNQKRCNTHTLWMYIHVQTHTRINTHTQHLYPGTTILTELIHNVQLGTIYLTTLNAIQTVPRLKKAPTPLCGPALAVQDFCKEMRAAGLLTVMKQKMALVFRDVNLEAFRNRSLHLKIKVNRDDSPEIIPFLRTQETGCHSSAPAPPPSLASDVSAWLVHLCSSLPLNSSPVSTVTISFFGKGTTIAPLDVVTSPLHPGLRFWHHPSSVSTPEHHCLASTPSVAPHCFRTRSVLPASSTQPWWCHRRGPLFCVSSQEPETRARSFLQRLQVYTAICYHVSWLLWNRPSWLSVTEFQFRVGCPSYSPVISLDALVGYQEGLSLVHCWTLISH